MRVRIALVPGGFGTFCSDIHRKCCPKVWLSVLPRLGFRFGDQGLADAAKGTSLESRSRDALESFTMTKTQSPQPGLVGPRSHVVHRENPSIARGTLGAEDAQPDPLITPASLLAVALIPVMLFLAAVVSALAVVVVTALRLRPWGNWQQ